MQVQDGVHRAIAYNSMTFSAAQKYSTIDREFAAMRWGIKVFRPFLFGVLFVLYTDHKPLVYMQTMAREDKRIYRTLEDLSDFDFEIRYCRGWDNVAADALSRMGVADQEYEKVDDGYMPAGLSVLQKVEGGGNSMLLSLMANLNHCENFINGDMKIPESTQQLREVLIGELLKQPNKCFDSWTRVLRKQVTTMKYKNTLLCPEGLLAFSVLFGLQIWVHCGMEHPIIYTLEDESTDLPERRMHLQLLAGVHDNPVCEGKAYKPMKSKGLFLSGLPAADRKEEHSEVEEVALAQLQWLKVCCVCQPSMHSVTTVSVAGNVYCAVWELLLK